MFPMTTRAGGLAIAMPDVCNTPAPPAPPMPMPYPCSVDMTQGDPNTCARKVSVAGAPAMMVGTEVVTTSGMEAGSLGGVVSGTVKGPARFTTGSAKVTIEGKAAAYQTCPLDANGTNANSKGVQSAPSQTKVLVAG
jgi:hypothetical protein